MNNNDNSTFYVTVTYHLKNNKTVIRNYDNTNSNVMLQILDLTDSKEYKDELEFLMSSKGQMKLQAVITPKKKLITNIISASSQVRKMQKLL